MDVLIARKDGELEQVGCIDLDDLLIETDDSLLAALFDEAVTSGVPVPVIAGEPDSGYELIRLTRSDSASAECFKTFVEHHGFKCRDVV